MSLPLTPVLGKGLGRIRDTHDVRDEKYTLRLSSPVHTALLPASCNTFSKFNPPVRDQGALGACTAFAMCTCREWLAMAFSQWSSPYQLLSPLYQYYQERLKDGDVNVDQGSGTRTTCEVACKIGFMPEANFPYDVNLFAAPTLAASPGLLEQRMAYHRLADLLTMKSVLASGYPFIIGMTVYQGIERVTATQPIMPLPIAKEAPIGGHEVCVIGYDDSMQSLRMRNSWGTLFGQGGDFWCPYAFIEDFNMSQYDAALIHLGPAWT